MCSLSETECGCKWASHGLGHSLPAEETSPRRAVRDPCHLALGSNIPLSLSPCCGP